MPFSVKVSAADQTGMGTAVPASGGAADAQAVTGLGDTFAALMQACLPSAQNSANEIGSQVGKASLQTSVPDPRSRTRKDAADAADPNAAQLLVAQLSAPVTTPEPLQVRDADTQDETANSAASNATAAPGMGQDPDTGIAVQLPASTGIPQQTGDNARSMQELMEKLSSAPDAAEPTITATALPQQAMQAAATQAPALHPPAVQANTPLAGPGSLPVPTPAVHPALTAAGVPAGTFDSTAPVLHGVNPKQSARIDAQRVPTNAPAISDAGSPASRQVAASSATTQATAASSAAAPVPPPAESGAQASSANPALQAAYTSQGAPAVALGVQTSGGDGASASQGDGGDDAPAERRGSQGASRTGTASTNGDTRVGMSGWVGTVQPQHDAAQQASETAPAARSGMTNLSLDRIAADSSARRLTNALRSDMSFGVQTEAFGKVNIQAALHGDQLASQISLEHAHLNASTLAAHLPGLEFTLGEKYKLDASVTIQNSHSAMGGGTQDSPSQGSSQQNAGSAPLQTFTSTSGMLASAATISPEQRQTSEWLVPAAGRLDLVI